MRFWDASALIPLLVPEAASAELRTLGGSESAIVVWWGSRVECVSAIRRLERERTRGSDPRPAIESLERLADTWVEVAPSEPLRTAAERALAVHPLRAGDALQLAAAITWRGQASERFEFVSLDERLRDAASREGFALVPAELGD